MSGRAVLPSGQSPMQSDDAARAVDRYVLRRQRFASQGMSPLVWDNRLSAIESQLESTQISSPRLCHDGRRSDESPNERPHVVSDADSSPSNGPFCDRLAVGSDAAAVPYLSERASSVVDTVNASESPMTTPKTKLQRKIDRYRKFVCSPSMFDVVKSPSESSTFQWDVEELAIMNPVDIDETDIQEIESPVDSETERALQEAIDEFFGNNLVVPSPDVLVNGNGALLAAEEPFDSPWAAMGLADKKRSVACQTVFTFARGFNFALFFGPTLFRLDDDQLVGIDKGNSCADRKRSHSDSTGLSEFEILSVLADGGECSLLKPGRKAVRLTARNRLYAESMMFKPVSAMLSPLRCIDDDDDDDQSALEENDVSATSSRSRVRLGASFTGRRLNFDSTKDEAEASTEKTKVSIRSKVVVDLQSNSKTESPLMSRESIDNIRKGERQH